MDIFEKSLALLDEYLSTTRREDITLEMSQIDNIESDGVTFEEYLLSFESDFSIDNFFQHPFLSDADLLVFPEITSLVDMSIEDYILEQESSEVKGNFPVNFTFDQSFKLAV